MKLGNIIGAKGARALGDALKVNTTLVKLSLGGMQRSKFTKAKAWNHQQK